MGHQAPVDWEGGPLPLATDSPSSAELVLRHAALAALTGDVIDCRRCPRLVAWREQVAAERTARFAHEAYWGRPLPGWGATDARLVVIGLAPAAHGGNRTGRIFTGDRSGDFLFAALHRAGLATRAESRHAGDGLAPVDLYIAAVNRCAPPANRPSPEERDNCLPYLARELALLTDARVVLALGAYAWDGVVRALAGGASLPRPRPRFGHGVEARIGRLAVIGSFHPSQQNTFTGRLTPAMLDAVLQRARRLADLPPARSTPTR